MGERWSLCYLKESVCLWIRRFWIGFKGAVGLLYICWLRFLVGDFDRNDFYNCAYESADFGSSGVDT
jgi:hypothetical protein